MQFINLTPHVLAIATPRGPISIESTGIARATEVRTSLGDVNGIPVCHVQFGDIQGVPDPAPGVAFIVSRVVAEAMPERDDLFFPGPAIRNGEGRIIGCSGLSRAVRK